jgi:VWFA-related protein
MKKQIALILFFSLIIAMPGATLAQTPSAPQQGEDRLATGTTEVIFDAVVKDKKGRPVKDLKATDFQISEEGVPQEVRSFRVVSGDTPESAPADAAKTPANARKATARVLEAFNAGRIGTVAMVFDRLSLDSRTRAHDAAISYIGTGMGQNDFIGVFGIDQGLTVVQTFTNNEQLVRQGIDRAGSASSSSYGDATSQITDLAQKDLVLSTQLAEAEGQAAGNQSAGNIGNLATDRALNAMSLRTAEGFQRLEQTQRGEATTDGLLAIIAAMGGVPGRKALVFFSEGVSIPTSVVANFRTVISNANRANVSIYAVDAAGLRATSNTAEAGKAMSTLGQTRIAQAGSKDDPSGSMMRDSERNEELVRHVPESGLTQLAVETGGMLVSGTNNPGARLHQVNDDLHSYYVLTYTPKNQNYDGKFRQINVKVNRSGVDVQARKGYYAVGASYDSPVLAYEAPALAILGGKAQTNGFVTRTAAFSFPETSKPGLVPIMVEVPSAAVNFVSDTARKTYRTDFSIVVVVKDELQHPVRKLSQQYLLSGDLDHLEAAKRGNILFYRVTDLEPGRYSVEAIAYDATNNQSSVSHNQLTVPDSDQTKLRISNLVVVAKTQKVAATDQQANPFRVGELMLFPNLGEPLHKAGSKGLSMFLTIYPPRGSTTAPKMSIELAQAGQPLGQLPVTLPAPDANGRIQYTGTIPLDAFPPGEYELKAMVSDGVTKAVRSERFTVQP